MSQQIVELQTRLRESESDIEYLNKIGEKLQANIPDLTSIITTILAKERQETERKNQKIIQILRHKDETIENLQKEVETHRSRAKDIKLKNRESKSTIKNLQQSYQKEVSQLRDQLDHENRQLKSAEIRASQSSMKLEEQERQQASIIASYENRANEWQKHKIQLEDELAQLKNQISDLKKTTDQKDKIINDLQQNIVELNKQIDKMRNQEDLDDIKQKQGSKKNVRFRDETMTTEVDPVISDLKEKVEILENLNETLEESLRESQRALSGNILR